MSSLYKLFNRSYRDYVGDAETLRLLNIIVLSVAVGMFLFSAQGGVAFVGYASALGAGEFAFGLISALPVLASLLQIPASYLVEKTGKYKTVFLVNGVIQRISWIVIAFIPFLFPVEESYLWALVILVTLAAMCGSFLAITHTTLLASVIPMEARGRYITTRQKVMTACGMVVGLFIALILDYVPGFTGYTIVFAVGGVAGLIDILMYASVSFSGIPRKPKQYSIFSSIKSSIASPKTRNYFIFWMFWSLAINLSVPFFNKYAIDVLLLSYVSMIFFGQIVSQLLALFVLSTWGRFLDRYGSVPMMMISATVATLGISVWLFASPGSVWVIFLFNFIGGLFWCANEACMVNMQISHTPSEGRPAALAVYAVLTSIAAATSFIIGGFLLETLSPIMENLNFTFMGTHFDHYKVLFSITIVARLIVIFIFLPRVWNEKEISISKTLTKVISDSKFKINWVLKGR
ncbi:MAG: MFS transporter [Oscillospiraceae bacterium]|jgi:MFS family permease|nr:MFS transporter [Oscillospiraceae bacterium]